MLTFLHPLVDFCSVAVLATGGITFERWLAYNALAFALQLPLGVWRSWAALWLVLLFIAQLATGPVLSLMYDATERRAGTAFGLNCLGLFTGSLF